MSYMRVIPRDLFNEADLLKCLGKLELALDNMQGHKASMTLLEGGDFPGTDGWAIEQNPDDGSIYSRNIEFLIDGDPYEIYRPLNSREKMPVYLRIPSGETDDIRVFTESGNLSREFCAFIEA